jgi:hypothetical protein
MFEAVNDPALAYDPAAQRFLVVLGDEVPREIAAAPGQPDPFPACAKSAVTDPGRDGVAGTPDDLHTKAVVDRLVATHTTPG